MSVFNGFKTLSRNKILFKDKSYIIGREFVDDEIYSQYIRIDVIADWLTNHGSFVSSQFTKKNQLIYDCQYNTFKFKKLSLREEEIGFTIVFDDKLFLYVPVNHLIVPGKSDISRKDTEIRYYSKHDELIDKVKAYSVKSGVNSVKS